MDKVLAPLIGKSIYIYVDDIVVYSPNNCQHAKDLEAVFKCLREAGLRMNPDKCTFARAEVKLLGYIVGGEGIRSNPEKVEAIVRMAPPTTVKGVRSFLGMAQYYRQTIPDFAKTAEPLVRLTRKNSRFEWTAEQNDSFEKLKLQLISPRVMAHPRIGVPYKLYTDSSDYAVGAILCQVDDQGVERVIQYISHQLRGAQLNYPVIKKEAFAVVYALTKLRPYLYGSDFTVFTDHKPLKSLFTKEIRNPTLQRWAVLLQDYSAKIKYHEGKRNIRADTLSRIKPQNVQIDVIDSSLQWVDPEAIPPEQSIQRIPLEADNLKADQIRVEQAAEFPELMGEALEEDSLYEIHGGLLYSIAQTTPTAAQYPRLILPSSAREGVIRRCHEAVGHMSLHKTLECVREAYLWAGMRKDIKEQLKKCPICLLHSRRQEHSVMGEIDLPHTNMEICGIDLIGPFCPSESGCQYVLTIICLLSGWAECYPLINKSARSVQDKFMKEFFPRHGIPRVIICDNGAEFNSTEIRQLFKDLGVEQRNCTPYSPTGNGKIERFNGILKSILAKLINNRRKEWENELPQALMCYRTAVSASTGFSPYQLLYGRRPRIPLSAALQCDQPASQFGNRLSDMASAMKMARENLMSSRIYNRERINARAARGNVIVGDTVILKANEKLTMTASWDPQWEVIRTRGQVVWLRHQQTGQQKVVNRNKVKVIDPNINWDAINPRPIRKRHRKAQEGTLTGPAIGFQPDPDPQVPVAGPIREEEAPEYVNEEEDTKDMDTQLVPGSVGARERTQRQESEREARYLKRCQWQTSPVLGASPKASPELKRRRIAPSLQESQEERMEALELAASYCY
jgi:transposase InsO family protein